MYIKEPEVMNIDKSPNSIKSLEFLNQNAIDPVKFLGFSWITYTDDKASKATTYIFREEKQELLVVKEGVVKKGSWEILKLSNSILINDGEQELLFSISYFGNIGIILKKENTDTYLILIKSTKHNLQEKSMDLVLDTLMDDYSRIQQQFTNISLDPTEDNFNFEDISEFHEYKLFPYVATLGSIVFIILILLIIFSTF